MTQENKKKLAKAKEHIDKARAELDKVRFDTENWLSDEEYLKVSEIHGLLCEATDILYNV